MSKPESAARREETMLRGWIGTWPEFPFLIPTLNARLLTQISVKMKATHHLHQGKIGYNAIKCVLTLY